MSTIRTMKDFSSLPPELMAYGDQVARIIRTIQANDPGQPITISMGGGELFIPGDSDKGGHVVKGGNPRPKKKRKKRRK